ncbi:ribosome 60S biogenesis N-terminal-domain-containing protein [Xylariaceae sp. FL0016]|nr:ribosome 60S biogenesis N-terminal-domain-containing protein [Xylariaceae sp. FL0016]
MAKRKSFGGEGGRGGKKQKVVHTHEAPTSEDVHTGRQLRQLLTFEQDLRKARHGLQSFKLLLDSIVNGEEASSEKRSIVLEFLESTKPKEVEDEVPIFLPDIMETWSMASQMGNENVMSAVPVVLALLLKFISADVDLTSYGLGVCRTLLQKRQQELLAKNLSAEKGKDFIISPTLRLLREAICMDGGTLAAPIFRARNNTYKSLARNIGLRYLGEGYEDFQRPSVRTNAVRFFLSGLRLLHVEAKRDLLSQKDLVAALMRHIRDDPPHLIYEILDVLKSSVVQEKKLPKDTKIKILNSNSLIRIASLYGYSGDATESEDDAKNGRPTVEEAAHELLLAACTDSSAGIHRSEQGYYPEDADPDEFLTSDDNPGSVEAGIDSIHWMSKYTNNIPVRNALLAEFIQSLRPWSSTKQSELLLAIFKNTPELIAQYFLQKRVFTFDPKLSATWMGYAALLYTVIQLPIPSYFGHSNGYAIRPPPTAVVLDNIIPQPITLKAITRCLTNKSKLISFYAVRIMVLSLQKLNQALEMHREASGSNKTVWDEAARRLIDGFYQRIPDIKDVINCYRNMADTDQLQREAASRLILLYYEVIPQIALRAKFDVSPMLVATIKKIEASGDADEEAAMSLLELDHLCTIAKYSPTMRWFARVSDMPTSPFTTLLRLYLEKSSALSGDRLGETLSYVADEYQLVESRQELSGLEPLLHVLRSTSDLDPAVWSFMDNCFERCARTPIKYLEMIEEQLAKVETGQDVDYITCPLLMTIAEQLPFLVSAAPGKTVMKQLTKLLSEFLCCSQTFGISPIFLSATKELFVTGVGDKKLGSKISFSSKAKAPKAKRASSCLGSGPGSENEGVAGDDVMINARDLEHRLSVPIVTSKENSLMKWATKTAEELVEEGYASALVNLLSSNHPSIRKEALTNITKMAAKIKESTYEENEQIWLLLMEVVESARETISNDPLPSVIVAFACRALDILKNPLHCLYEKTNLFLTSGPIWALDNIPLMQNILQDGPTLDSTFYQEISWLFGFLLDSLRIPQDVGLFHKRRVYERILGLTTNPYMGPNLRTQALRILYRTTSIEGGSDTLITRFGVLSWLGMQKASTTDNGERDLYQAMIRRLWDTCDQQRISAWSNGGIEKLAFI